MAGSVDALVERLLHRERTVWLAAVALYGVGDFLTTAVGLATGRGAEAGPLAAPLVADHGLAGLLLKAVTLAGCYLVWRVVRTPGRVAVPLALVFVGGVVTAWNLLVLA